MTGDIVKAKDAIHEAMGNARGATELSRIYAQILAELELQLDCCMSYFLS